jgi:sugar/nucleoside kinase (ribokinase family)
MKNEERNSFNKVIGTGGIGAGILFQLDSNEPLGRNESRPAILSDTKDYCKQHIILHYIAKALYPGTDVYAIGKVGCDADGQRLLEEMDAAHIRTDAVGTDSLLPTMFSTCIQYSDKAVCNVTSSNSASTLVTPEYVRDSLTRLPIIDAATIIMAAPEVSVDARVELLRAGKKGGAFCVASFASAEAAAFVAQGGVVFTDLLSLNEDEARAFIQTDASHTADGLAIKETDELILACIQKIKFLGSNASLIVTLGSRGSVCHHRGRTVYLPARPAKVVATGGAGDAYIAGVICGLCSGLPLLPPPNAGPSAMQLGTIFAKKSVEHKDTIVPTIGPCDNIKAAR